MTPEKDTRRFGGAWAKAEIFLGLIAAGLGLAFGYLALTQPHPDLGWAASGLSLFVLGGYLVLAGHRSHLYRFMQEQTNILLHHNPGARNPTS